MLVNTTKNWGVVGGCGEWGWKQLDELPDFPVLAKICWELPILLLGGGGGGGNRQNIKSYNPWFEYIM